MKAVYCFLIVPLMRENTNFQIKSKSPGPDNVHPRSLKELIVDSVELSFIMFYV